MKTFSDEEKLQKQHFDAWVSDYARHYGDAWSQAYRHRFINEPLLGDIDFSGSQVVDALCGSGESTEYLLGKGARVTGVDISEEEMARFQKRFPDCRAICSSILSTGLESNAFDRVVLIEGLHHLHPQVPAAIQEIHRVLKPGGLFCFAEPHQGSAPDALRRLWYKCDKLFADNEAAIDLEGLKKEFASRFEFVKEKYGGNLAYLLVLNSLIFRVPLGLKRVYSPVVMGMESILQKIQGKRSSCFVMCRWKKK